MKKPKFSFKLKLILLFFIVLNSCAKYSEEKTESNEIDQPSYNEVDTLNVSVDTTAYIPDSVAAEEPVKLDTTTFVPDSIAIPPIEERPSIKSATLGYTYPPKLKKGEIGDVNVKVEIKNPNSTLRQELTEVLISQSIDQNPKNDSIVIYSETIPFYKELNITLSDDAKDFQISSKHLNDTQFIDSISGNSWHWTIIPITDKRKAQLMLKIVATDNKGYSKIFEPKRIFIDIDLDNVTAFRRFVNYLLENPAVSVPILISFFGFIGFLIRQKLNKKIPDA